MLPYTYGAMTGKTLQARALRGCAALSWAVPCRAYRNTESPSSDNAANDRLSRCLSHVQSLLYVLPFCPPPPPLSPCISNVPSDPSFLAVRAMRLSRKLYAGLVGRRTYRCPAGVHAHVVPVQTHGRTYLISWPVARHKSEAGAHPSLDTLPHIDIWRDSLYNSTS